MADDVRPPLLTWTGILLTRHGGLTSDPDCCCPCPATECLSISLSVYPIGWYAPEPIELRDHWPDYAIGEWVYWKLISNGVAYYETGDPPIRLNQFVFLNYAACATIEGGQPDCFAMSDAFVNWFLSKGWPQEIISELLCAGCKTEAELDDVAIQFALGAGTAGDDGQFEWLLRRPAKLASKCGGGVAK